MLWWLSVAPLGKPVVPLVYWMLMGSSKVELGLPVLHPSRLHAVAVGQQ